jgi:pimeloyl-ACP methyl ester carboxylesterase
MDQAAFNSSKGLIRYTRIGMGKPVMLIHGFGEDSTVWEKQIPELSKNYLLLVPDLPGSGHSPMINEGSMETYAAVLKELCDYEKIAKLVLIGHSMGGYITLAFLENWPDMVSAYCLFHSSAYADDEEKIATRKKGIEFIEKNGAAKFLQQATPNLFSEKTRNERPELVKEILDRYANFSGEALVQYYQAMIKRPDRTHILKNSNKSFLIIAGKYDTAVPLQKSLEQSHIAAFSYIHICNNSGHMGMLEQPQECNEVLSKFLGELEP